MNEFFSGALSGSLGTIISHPLDTLKTWKQTNYKITNIQAKDVFRGWKFPVYNSLIINSIMFGGNNKIKEEVGNEFISGAITGSFIGVITNPLDLYKIKLQNKNNISNVNPFKGLPLTMKREIIGCSIYFGSYNYFKENKIPIFVSGGLSGWLGWLSTYPIDVVKTRVQANNISYISAIKLGNFWSGFMYCSIRAILNNGIIFSSYEFFTNNTICKSDI